MNARPAWRRRARLALAALLVGSTLMGCTIGSAPRQTSPTSRSVDSAIQDRIVSKMSSGSGPHGFGFQVSYPQLTSLQDPAQERRVNPLLREQAMSIVADYQRISKDQPRTRLRVDFQVRLYTEPVLSVLFRSDLYAPQWARPVLEWTYLNISLQDGRRVALQDLFLDGANYIVPLIVGAARRLHQQLGDDLRVGDKVRSVALNQWSRNNSVSLSSALDELDLESRFLLRQDGVQFHWPSCMVAVCAAGDVSITVPYSELQELIDQDGPLAGIT